MKNQVNHARHHVGLILALAGLMSGVTLMPGPVRVVSAQAVAPSWSYTGNLNTVRDGHTATLLSNGKVLVVGGSGSGNNPAELYNPATGTWSYTGYSYFNVNRHGHTATLLPNGKVLVAGGTTDDVWPITDAELLYDPTPGTWSSTGSLNTARVGHTATLLPNGKVLVVGGGDAELYDSATGTWSSIANGFFYGGVVTLLQNGKVLVGTSTLYDPATGMWSQTGSLNTDRVFYTATLLPNGKVLVAGGEGSCEECFPLKSAELYDPATGTWSITGDLNTVRFIHTATLLPNGKVLVAGGFDDSSRERPILRSSELYDPATGTWSINAYLNTLRFNYTATLLLNGKILVAGGITCHDGVCNQTRTAELYDPSLSPNSTLIDDAQFFVHQHYSDFLNREPDSAGLAYWTSQITQCGSDARCIHERRIGVSAAFFIELEFQDTGYYVYRFYKASFGRQPSYAEFTSDRSRVIGGSNLEANKQAFADEWVQRDAFTQAYPNTMSNTEVVNKLFDTAGLTASIYDAQRQQEIQSLNAGRSRALVLRDVIEIPDFKNIADPNDPRYSELKQTSQYNPAFVLMQYFGYLRRDADQGGYDFWLNVLNNGAANNHRGMVCAFVTSTEYQLRFGPLVTRSNADCVQ